MTHYYYTQNNPYFEVIHNLGAMNQYLISRSLDHGFFNNARELKKLDNHLLRLLEYKGFNFLAQIAKGKSLFVGEGNLSFVQSLLGKKVIAASNITATTIEGKNSLPDGGIENAKYLATAGTRVLHNVDATKLSKVFGNEKFDNIIFQFPHTGSREPIRGRNPNFILVRDFLKSSANQLNQSGTVLISAVDSPHYDGAFSFDEAAKLAGFEKPKLYKFNPTSYNGYEHTMTHEDDNALNNHKNFKTWVFKLKGS